jgi:hypothetical protein
MLRVLDRRYRHASEPNWCFADETILHRSGRTSVTTLQQCVDGSKANSWEALMATTATAKKHGAGRHVATFLLIAFNLLMLAWAIVTWMAPQAAQCSGGVSNGQVGCEAANGLVSGFGVGIVVVIWFVGAAVLVGIRKATR